MQKHKRQLSDPPQMALASELMRAKARCQGAELQSGSLDNEKFPHDRLDCQKPEKGERTKDRSLVILGPITPLGVIEKRSIYANWNDRYT